MTEEIKKIEKTELIEKELDSVTGGAASPPPPLTTKPAPQVAESAQESTACDTGIS